MSEETTVEGKKDYTKFIIIGVAVLLVLLIAYQLYSKRSEGYNKNRTTRDDPQGDWSIEDRIREILAKQERNLLS